MLTFRRTGLICPTKAEEIRQRISRHILIFRRLFGIICKAWRVTQVVEEAWLEIRVGSGRFLRWKSLIYKGFPRIEFQNFILFLPVFLAFSQRTENSWDIRRAIEEVITRTTRNRLTAKNRPWVRIPRPPPQFVRKLVLDASFRTFLLSFSLVSIKKVRGLRSHSLNQGLDPHHGDGSRHVAGRETQPQLHWGFHLSLAQQIVCASVPLHRSKRMLWKAHSLL